MKNIWDVNWKKNRSADMHPELIDLVEKYATGKKVLEVGFGTGGDLLELSKKGFDCYGIETSKIAFQRARKSKKFKVLLQNGEKTSFADTEFDLIFHQGVLEHFKNSKKFLREHYRLLKTSGIVVIDVPHKWNLFTLYKNIRMFFKNWYGGWERSFSTQEITQLLSKNYFDVVEIKYRGIWPHQWGKFLFPEKIIKNKWATRLIFSPPIKQIQEAVRKIYDSSHLIRLLSAYNIVVVAKKRKLRIGFDGRYAEGDLVGIGKYIKSLVTDVSGFGVECVLFYSQKPKFNIEGKNIKRVILKSTNRYLFEQVLLPQALKKEKIDIYHAMGNVGIPIFCPIPSVLTVHDIIPLEIKDYFSFSPYPFLSRLSSTLRLRTSTSKANKIVTVSLFVKRELVLRLKILVIRITNIYSGGPRVVKKGELPEVLKGEKYILDQGGIDIRKNLPNLIRSFAFTNLKYPAVKLVITGRNENMMPDLKKLIKDLGLQKQVIFTGYLDEATLWAVIKNANMVCFPSLSEGFGFPVLEGFAAGVPVIASNSSSIPEVAGEGALLIDPNRIDEIAVAIVRVLTDQELRKKMVLKGKEQYNKFSWKKAANEYLRLYYSL